MAYGVSLAGVRRQHVYISTPGSAHSPYCPTLYRSGLSIIHTLFNFLVAAYGVGLGAAAKEVRGRGGKRSISLAASIHCAPAIFCQGLAVPSRAGLQDRAGRCRCGSLLNILVTPASRGRCVCKGLGLLLSPLGCSLRYPLNCPLPASGRPSNPYVARRGLPNIHERVHGSHQLPNYLFNFCKKYFSLVN